MLVGMLLLLALCSYWAWSTGSVAGFGVGVFMIMLMEMTSRWVSEKEGKRMEKEGELPYWLFDFLDGYYQKGLSPNLYELKVLFPRYEWRLICSEVKDQVFGETESGYNIPHQAGYIKVTKLPLIAKDVLPRWVDECLSWCEEQGIKGDYLQAIESMLPGHHINIILSERPEAATFEFKRNSPQPTPAVTPPRNRQETADEGYW